MSDVVFVVTTQDFNYKDPIVLIRYAGNSMKKAYEVYDDEIGKRDWYARITLDLVHETTMRRLETHENKFKK